MLKTYKAYILVLLPLVILIAATVSQEVATPSGDAQYHLEGYSRDMVKWTRGILKGWLEENWVPYRLQLASIVPGSFEITIQHDHEWTGSGGPDPGVDNCKSTAGKPLFGEPLFLEEPTDTNFWVGDASGSDTGISVNTVRESDLIEPNTVVIQYKSSFTIPSTYGGKTLYLYWMAHLATGSSGWSGASLHAHTTATGRQDVPIAVPPNNKIFGYKFYDANRNGKMEAGESGIAAWTIYAEGLYLGSPVKFEKKTDTAGYYEFSGLPDGTCTLTEEHKSGWIETTASPYKLSVKGGQTKGPYNFGNFQVTPGISVTKSGPQMAHEGDTITYSYTVTNTGNSPLSDVSLVDDKAGTVVTGQTLAVGESKSFTKSYTIPAGALDPLENTVTAQGKDELGTQVSAKASWKVDIIHPKIVIDKTGPERAHEGDKITYEYVVTNPGDVPLGSVTVTDNKAGTATYESGDTNNNGKLDLTETWKFKASYTVLVSDPDPLTNIGTASGTDPLGLTKTAQDTWKVDILHPKIDIVKTATPDTINPGESVTYEYKVTNIGDCVLLDIKVTDDKLGEIGTIASLDVGQSQTLKKSAQLFVDTTNVGTATGKDELGKEVSDSDDAIVHVTTPPPPPPKNPPSFGFKCISQVEQVKLGGTKTLTFVAANTGVPQSRIYYLTFSAVIQDYSLLKFVGPPYTAHIKIYYNDGSTWEADVSGTLTKEKFSGFDVIGDYWMVTWRVPTTYPAKPYLEGNYGGYLNAKVETSFQVTGVAQGSTWLIFFPRATEDHHVAGVPLGSVADRANIWESGGFWYPVHNSYDPYDDDIGTGHAFVNPSWVSLPTTNKYARAVRFIDIVP